MEKYATYEVFENKNTKEIKRVSLTDKEELAKIAEAPEWKQLDNDPEDVKTKESK
jgi:hypothetical protein